MEDLILPTKGVIEDDVVGVNDTDVAFSYNEDELGNPLPSAFLVTGIDVIPHDAASPKVAASTIWRLRIYRTVAMAIEDLVYEDTRYGGPVSDVPSFDNTPWEYMARGDFNHIYGTIGIENGATDCSFRIRIKFERRK